MATLSPLLVKKHRGKSRKYISTDVTSPYATLDKTHSRQKSMKNTVGNVVAPKVCHQYEEALRRRDFRQVLWMITNGNIHANYETKTGETALLAAVSAKNLDALAILMTSGVSIDTSNRQGYTPLMKAIAVAVPRYNSLPKTISPSNNNMDESTHSGASVNVHENEIVANVLKYEPNLLQTDKSGRTAFDWAKLTGNVEALEWLEKRQREKSMKHQSAANRQERVAQCLELLNQHEGYIQSINDLIAPQFFGEEALVTFLKSTMITSAEFAKALSDLKDMEDIARSRSFQSQFFVNIETREGWTPLAKCAAFGYVAAVQELLAMGADLHYETRLRHTAMTWASYCGHEAVVLHLLRIGVNVDQKTRDGKTALMHAVSNSQAKIVHHLLIATRDQCFPTKPIETFSSEIDLKVSKLKFGHRPKEVKTIETEWHAVFLKKIRWKDQTGKDAVELAQVALEQAQLLTEDGSSSYHDEAAIQVLHQVQTAIKEAEEHKNYVGIHADRTEITVCRNEGCSFRAPKDVLPTHENHHCVKRTIKCDNCSASVIFEDRKRHDEQFCSTRRVICTNFQFGCQEQMLFQDREHHLRFHCRKRPMECRLLCGATVRFEELEEHESVRCPLRLVNCDLGCQATFRANVSKNHRLHQCPKRMVPCTGRNSVNGGCGIMVKCDEMDFHLSTLCETREISCKWAVHGCEEKIAGVAAARHTHETKECPFRLVSCRNGCELSGQILACFVEQHYRWQCMLEQEPCPNECQTLAGEIQVLPRHLLMVHGLQDAGDCPSRKTHCPLDLCGKHIRLFDTDPQNRDILQTGDGGLSQLENRITSFRAIQQRISIYDTIVAGFQGLEQQGESGEARNICKKKVTAMFLMHWLQSLHANLQQEYQELKIQRDAESRLCRILTFDSSKSQHLIEFPDGHSIWMQLALREYDIILPDSSDDIAAKFQYFRCGLLPAQTLENHTEEDCCHRLVHCPLSCGQRLPAQTIEFHLEKSCNKRNIVCRLGCGEIVAFALVAEHEAENCALRREFCDFCHKSQPVKTMEVHLAKECQDRPRGCRLGCRLKVSLGDIVEHEAKECPKRLVKCRICDGEIWFAEREIHENNECPLRVYGKCDGGCGVTLRHNEVAHHLLFSCTERIVDCKLCKQRLPFSSLQEHHQLICPQRVVNCRRWCGIQLKELETQQHEDEECSKRLLFCENQCGLYVPYCEMQKHLKSKCSMRVMECPSGCRDWIFAYLCEDHWKRCRQRLVPCGVGGKLCARPIRVWHMGNKLVRCAVHGENALLWALKSQDLDLATYLLQNVDAFNVVNEEFANGFSPLVLAASLGNVDLIQLLLRFGADVNFETSRGRTPLSEACIAQDPVIVKMLIDHRASVTHTNRQGRTLLQMAHAFAESDTSGGSKWKEIIQLLEEQAELERAQRDLFIAISCSNYDYLTQYFKYSAKTSSHTFQSANPFEALQELVITKEKQAEVVRAELAEAVQVFNESIAETEAKRVEAIHLSSQVDDGCRRLQSVEKAEEASDIDSGALEAEMLAMIREITAQDIAQLLNSHVPSETSLVVMKALSLLCGVVPRGRRNATEYTDVEWWKTAQALLMDRSLLRRLRGYRQQPVSPDVMAKVRRECLKSPAFTACTAEFKASCETSNTDTEERSKIPPPERLRGNIVGILATWVQGVEIEYKARADRQVLMERKRRLAVSLSVAREKQQHAAFEAQVEARSLPARQEEVETVRAESAKAEQELEVAKKRLNTYKLLNYAALSGHTPLTFACAVGNEAIVHMLLSHGACSGYQFEEQSLCASFIQVLVRDYQYRKKFARERRLQELSEGGIKPRSDAAIEALVRNVAHAFIVGHYTRKLVHFRQTHRVALHEAVLNGYPEIAAILLSKEAKLWQKTHVLPGRVYPGALLENVAPISKHLQEQVKRKGNWKLQPLVKEQKKSQIDQENSDDIFCKPMTIAYTLKCAVKYYDSGLFHVSKGWEAAGVTFYSATANFVNDSLAKLEASQLQLQKELVLKRNVIRKTAELKEKHAKLDEAIISRDFVAASRLLDEGAFADYETNSAGLSAVMAACIEEVFVQNGDGQNVIAVEFLLDRPTNHPLVNFESSRGLTALGTAAFYGTINCAKVLIERGASVNLASRLTGRTALMIAADNGKEAFVRFLVGIKEIDTFLCDVKGKTALDYARARGFIEISGILEAAMARTYGRPVSRSSKNYRLPRFQNVE